MLTAAYLVPNQKEGVRLPYFAPYLAGLIVPTTEMHVMSMCFQNWYRLAKKYKDVQQQDYPTEKEFLANQYWSIGQSESVNQSYAWIVINKRLHASNEIPSHKAVATRAGFAGDIEKLYRGWYDPDQELVSIIIPRRLGVAYQVSETDIPNTIDLTLREQFGDVFAYKVF